VTIAELSLPYKKCGSTTFFIRLITSKITVLVKPCFCGGIVSIQGCFRLIRPVSRVMASSWKLQEVDVDVGLQVVSSLHLVWLEPVVSQSQESDAIFLC
jgi:hypothetical protein